MAMKISFRFFGHQHQFDFSTGLSFSLGEVGANNADVFGKFGDIFLNEGITDIR